MKAIFLNIAVEKAGAPEQRKTPQALPSAQSILRAPHLGISKQLPITRKQLNLFHADDLIGMAMLNKLEPMATGMADLLQRFPDAKAEERAWPRP